MEPIEKNDMIMGNGDDWCFLNGDWKDEQGRVMVSPEGADVEYIAVRRNEVYEDFTASFRFRLRNIASVRFLFRMQDIERYYALDIPMGGQQFTTRLFWAGMVIADGSPLQRYLSFRHIPGLCAWLGRWYEVKVEAKGTRFRAWIDGLPVAEAEDSTYKSGHLGLANIQNPYIGAPEFDRLRIIGTPKAAREGLRLAQPPQHWITPCAKTDPETYQGYATLLKTGTGRAALNIAFGDPNHGERKYTLSVKTDDGGRTWGVPVPASLIAGFRASFIRDDGTCVCVSLDESNPGGPLLRYESSDNGDTWEGPLPLVISGGWPSGWKAFSVWDPVRLRDGSIVLPVICSPKKQPVPGGPETIYRQYFTAFAFRSTDDGGSWSAPSVCDSHHDLPGVPWPGNLPLEVYGGRFFEVAIEETDDGTLTGIGRPGLDPYMWQIKSLDGGKSWEPASIGHFPGYCPSLTRVSCGALVATVRFPYFSAHVSRDGGRTWSLPYIIDYCCWANQQAVEIEKDVVLVTYMGKIMNPGEADSRIVRIRVTGEGILLDH